MIDLISLTKWFGDERGVSNLNLEVQPHQVFGFLGPNGAGKSTTIRLLMGLYLPSAGRAEVFGLDASTHGPQVRRRVGLPSRASSPCTHASPAARSSTEWPRIRGDVDPRPARPASRRRFAAELDRPVHTLSKGNRQKIGLIQAFMHDPELLVLDEPTSGLDPLLQKEFADLLEESVSRGRTVFLSSHDLDEVQRLAHQIAIIRDGCLVAVDTVAGAAGTDRRGRSSSPSAPRSTPPRSTDSTGTKVTSSTGPRVSLTVDGEVGPLLATAAHDGRGRHRRAGPPTSTSSSAATTATIRGWAPVSGDIARWDLRLRRRSTLAYSIGVGGLRAAHRGALPDLRARHARSTT